MVWFLLNRKRTSSLSFGFAVPGTGPTTKSRLTWSRLTTVPTPLEPTATGLTPVGWIARLRPEPQGRHGRVELHERP